MTDPVQHPYPECDRLLAVHDESQAIADFLEDSEYVLALWVEADECHDKCCYGDHPHLVSVGTSIEKILAAYFKIDLAKVERERRAMLRDVSG